MAVIASLQPFTFLFVVGMGACDHCHYSVDTSVTSVNIYFKTFNKSLNKARVLYLTLIRGVWVLPPEDSSLFFNLSSKLEDKLEDREESSGGKTHSHLVSVKKFLK